MSKNRYPVFLTILAAFLFFFFYRAKTPMSYISNWDLLHHIHLIKQLNNGHFSPILNHISDTFTFNSYTPLFHILIAVPVFLLKIDVLKFVWFAEFFHYLFTTLVSYWMGNKIFKNKLGGLATALISLFIFESTVAYTTLYFLPMTVAGTLGALFIINIITTEQDKPVIKKMLITSLIVFLLHYMIGVAYFLFMLIEYIFRRLTTTSQKKTLVIICFFLFLVSLFFGIFNVNFAFTSRPDAKHFIYDLSELLHMLYQWYGILPIVFIPYGIYNLTKNWEDINLKIILAALFFSGLAFFPISYSLKSYVLARYFVNLLIVAGILATISHLKSKTTQKISFFLIYLAFFSVFYVNLMHHLQLSDNGKQNSYVSRADFEAADWLKNNFASKKVFVISDPTTQAVFEALAGVNSQGGAFPRLDTVKYLSSISKETNPEIIFETLGKIHDTLPDQDNRDVTLIIFSGRYFYWQKFGFEYKINYAYQSWLPRKINYQDQNYLKKISNNNFFKVIFANDENTIFEFK